MHAKSRYSRITIISIVVANMIGTGVFTSLGFQLLDIKSGFGILLLWTLGGIAAFSGAVAYAELGAALKKSGGEYQFLGRVYHPAAGFVSGWISAAVGFAAPTALAAITFAAYVTAAFMPGAGNGQRSVLAIGLILVLTAVHCAKRQAGGALQTLFTLLKILVIIAFCLAAFFYDPNLQRVSFMPVQSDLSVATSHGFAVSLIYVSFAYTGWNAATYLIGEIERPEHNLPIILGAGAVIVTILYVALNAAFLLAAPMDAMRGEIEVGHIAAVSMFGDQAGAFVAAVMAALLISTVSAMTIAGPRVLRAIGDDYKAFSIFSRVSADQIPRRAIMFQSTLAIIFILTGSFERILVFAGSLVALNSFAAVVGLFVLRWREPDLERPYKAFGYPVIPAIYPCVTGWAIFYALSSRPIEAALILGVITAGVAMYLALRAREGRAAQSLEADNLDSAL